MEREAEPGADEHLGAFERVIVELDWYDGVRAGIADLDGMPHYFHTEDCTHPPDEAMFLTWPIDESTLELEIESWQLFVQWNDLHEAGLATAESHPGRGGVNPRYDELMQLLERRRVPPVSAVPRRAQWRGTGRPKRYEPAGPASEVRWRNVNGDQR